MIRTRSRTMIAGVAIGAALTFGGAGLAGAAGTASPSTTSPSTATTPATTPATHADRCARAEKVGARITKRETKAATVLPKMEAREAKAKAAGHIKQAAAIENRIDRVKKLEARGDQVLAKIAAKCGSATPAS